MKEEFDKELRELSPLLTYLKKEQAGDGFKVPKFYFDTLADKVIAQAKETEKVGTDLKKKTPQYPTLLARLQDFMGSLLRPQLALAFGSCLIVALGAWFWLTAKNTTSTTIEPSVAATTPTNGHELPNAIELPNGVNNAETTATMTHNAPNSPKSGAIVPNSTPNDVTTTPQNSIKSNDTEGANNLVNNAPLTHPQSGLTEEELAKYLEENTDEEDSDGSDNKL
jgi:hypothetical protein